MANVYDPTVWKNKPDLSTPITAEALNKHENATAELSKAVVYLEENPGTPGPPGPPGPAYEGPVMFGGQGAPPDVIVGAKPGDFWVDIITGMSYVIT